MDRWRHATPSVLLVLALALALAGGSICGGGDAPADALPHRSPFDVVLAPGSSAAAPGIAWVSDRTAGVVVAVDLARGEAVAEVALRGEPTGLAISADGARLYASEYDAGSVAEIDVEAKAVRRRFAVGLRPLGLALAPGRLVVGNTVSHDVSIVDLESGRETARVAVPREPYFVATTPDGAFAIAANLLPAGSPRGDPGHAARVSLIDLAGGGGPRVAADVALPPGSTSVRQVRVSPDGRWAYAVHTVGRFRVPPVQLERGWINTSGLSIIDLARRELHATVLLDSFDEGAADPWGVAVSADGKRLWTTLRGTHQLAVVDLERLHALLAGEESVEDGGWRRIHGDPALRRELVNDLTALERAGLSRRVPLPVRGPRGIALAGDGGLLVVAGSFSGDVALIDADSGESRRTIAVGPRPEPDLVRLGEALFHDATLSFQSWLSCSTCHPDRGRNDALTWDLPNDGLGTPQMTRSLLMSYRVAPTTARGVRQDFRASVVAGFHFLNAEPDPERVEAIMAYLRSLRPEPSPHLAPDGPLTPAQERGRAIFEGKGRCSSCHSGPLRTDLERHDVGTAGEDELGGTAFYTPKLLELYRTAPFLHDGRAPDLLSIFTEHDSSGRHGRASELGKDELRDLIAYLLTL